MREKKQENQIKPSRPKSEVWEYFDDCFDGKHVKCTVCEMKGKVAKYTVTDGGTKTLRDHIKNIHKKEWSEMAANEEKSELEKTEDENQPKKIKLDPNQPTIKQQLN